MPRTNHQHSSQYLPARAAHVASFLFAAIASTACHPTNHSHDTTVGSITISNAVLVTPVANAPAAMYFTIHNAGTTPDTITTVHVNGVTSADMHDEQISATSSGTSMPGMPMSHQMSGMTMVAIPTVAIPASSDVYFAPGGRHVMLTGMQRQFASGDSTSADLTLAHAGTIHIPVRVVDYPQLDTLHLGAPKGR